MFRQSNKAEYNAEDINGDSGEDGGYYPAMADYSLPFSMANIWKKKADELGNFNAMEHLALMEKIEQMQKYNGSVVYSGPPSPPSMPQFAAITQTDTAGVDIFLKSPSPLLLPPCLTRP